MMKAKNQGDNVASYKSEGANLQYWNISASQSYQHPAQYSFCHHSLRYDDWFQPEEPDEAALKGQSRQFVYDIRMILWKKLKGLSIKLVVELW